MDGMQLRVGLIAQVDSRSGRQNSILGAVGRQEDLSRENVHLFGLLRHLHQALSNYVGRTEMFSSSAMPSRGDPTLLGRSSTAHHPQTSPSSSEVEASRFAPCRSFPATFPATQRPARLVLPLASTTLSTSGYRL